MGVEDVGVGGQQRARARRHIGRRARARGRSASVTLRRANRRRPGSCASDTVPAMPDVVIYADTVRSPELRHEVPLGVPDPFLYVERDGARHVVVGSMEIPRLRGPRRLRAAPARGVRHRRAAASGMPRPEICDEIPCARCAALGVTSGGRPGGVPAAARRPAARGGRRADARARRSSTTAAASKYAAELAGIRRAQAAAEAGMAAARDLLRRASANGGGARGRRRAADLERVKVAIAQAFVEHGTTADDFIVSHGEQSAIGHHMGEGPILAGETIVIDLWPRDNESSCYADMTRTFVVGDVPDEVAEWHRLVKEALDRALADIRPGVAGEDLFDGTCEIFEAAGLSDPAHEDAGQAARGRLLPLASATASGSRCTRQPVLGLAATRADRRRRRHRRAGSLPPGLRRCRLEDLVLVTEDGAENLTDFPYDLRAVSTEALRRTAVPREPGDRDAPARGAALPAAARVRRAGERAARRSTTRTSRRSGSARAASGSTGSSRSRSCSSGSARTRSGTSAAS